MSRLDDILHSLAIELGVTWPGESNPETAMAEKAFDPPLHIAPNLTVSTLDAAASVVRRRMVAGDPQDESVLRRLEGAGAVNEVAEAANAFREWAETKQILLPPK